MPHTRYQEPWNRQAARGISLAVALGLAVIAVGALMATAVVWALRLL